MDLNTEAPITERQIPISTGSDSTQQRERVSVRDTIRNSFAEARQSDERKRESEIKEDESKEEKEIESVSDTEREASAGIVRDEAEDNAVTDAGTNAGTAEDDKVEAAPTAWTKESKAEWENIPEKIRKEILKRERDSEKGVKLLKDKYKEVDEAIAPYLQTIQSFNKTPGQAVGQLFAWFRALAEDPDRSFPALLDSYNYDLRRLVEAKYPGAINRLNQLEQWYKQVQSNQQQRQNGQAQAQNGQVQNGQAQDGQAQPPVHPQVQAYINQLAQHNQALEQRLAGIEGNFGNYINSQNQYYEQQNAARTKDMLETWAQNRPYFERVRMKMGYLLSPDPNTGQAAIPLKDGKVDLDEAYNQAIWMDPEIRAEMWAEQKAQEAAARKAKADAALKAQQEKAAAAQKASGSLTTSAPGGEIGRKTSPEKGMSVRESLKQAISQLADR